MGAISERDKDYLPRIVDLQVQRGLSSSGAILLEGPRGCDKTMTGMYHANSSVLLDDPRVQKLIEVDPDFPLTGESPRLIDEWQLSPHVWNQVRRAVDRKEGFGHFILTGSSVPADDVTRHTGAARFMRIKQRTMTWLEKGFSEPQVLLRELFEGKTVATNPHQFTLDRIIEALLTSGFPAQRTLSPEQAQEVLASYLHEITHTDVYRIAALRHDPIVVEQLIKALARSVATEVSVSTLRKDLLSVSPTITAESVAKLLDLLQRVFAVEAVPPWAPTLRSRARLRRARKYHLADASLAAAALGANADTLATDVETLGFLFKSAVIHDLAVMVEAMGGTLYHYRDSNGYEIDAVLQLFDGRWAAVEITLGYGQVEAGIKRLQRAVEQIDADQPPAFMAVISGTGMSYTDPSGVVTFPHLGLGFSNP
ncbi:MAG: DUF4143 domain-containing protein [Corynebacterium sp.]|uniref:ATP-binding protein n=1 Tax=Corynebacterium sp. TaxID=1720 RepID=UPI0026DCD846|nr:DUF4143 domain-containing protein [Corynebacterium sp.]MDO4762107.1 DUF4143 domain-containing protein [Corynebacterium sp.]